MSNKLCRIFRKMSCSTCSGTEVAGTSTSNSCICGYAESESCKCFTQRASNCPSRPDYYVSPVWDITEDRVDYSCKVKGVNAACPPPATCRCKRRRPGRPDCGSVGGASTCGCNGCNSCNGCNNGCGGCGCNHCKPCPCPPRPPLPVDNCNPPLRITFPGGNQCVPAFVTMSGTGKPGSAVTVVINGYPNLQTVVDTNGNWTASVAPGMSLSPGRYAATVTMNGPDGCYAEVRTSICVQSGTLNPPAIDYPTGTTTDTTPAFGGRGIAGATVTVVVDGIGRWTTTVDQQGYWRVDPGVTFPYGSHTVWAFQSYRGSISSSVSGSFTVAQRV